MSQLVPKVICAKADPSGWGDCHIHGPHSYFHLFVSPKQNKSQFFLYTFYSINTFFILCNFYFHQFFLYHQSVVLLVRFFSAWRLQSLSVLGMWDFFRVKCLSMTFLYSKLLRFLFCPNLILSVIDYFNESVSRCHKALFGLIFPKFVRTYRKPFWAYLRNFVHLSFKRCADLKRSRLVVILFCLKKASLIYCLQSSKIAMTSQLKNWLDNSLRQQHLKTWRTAKTSISTRVKPTLIFHLDQTKKPKWTTKRFWTFTNFVESCCVLKMKCLLKSRILWNLKPRVSNWIILYYITA